MSQPAASLAAKVVARASKAGLPSELVPTEITADSAAVVAAESRLQAATHDLIARIRAAENAARAAGKIELPPADWLDFWSA